MVAVGAAVAVAGSLALSAGALPAVAASTSASASLVGSRPGATRLPFALWDRANVSVDVGTGNLLVSTTDLSLPGIKGNLSLGLTFNSLRLASGSALPVGSAGDGWAMPYGQDSQVFSRSDGSVLVLSPDGREGVYTPVSGSSTAYTSPSEAKTTLVKTTSGWSLTDLPSAQVTHYDLSGRLLDITDRNSQATRFLPVGGPLASIVSTAGGATSKKADVALNPAGTHE